MDNSATPSTSLDTASLDTVSASPDDAQAAALFDYQDNDELLPTVAAYLHQLNEVVIPMVLENGSVPNAINAREGLANLTKAFVTRAQDVAYVTDDVIAAAPDVDSRMAYDVPVRIYAPVLPNEVSDDMSSDVNAQAYQADQAHSCVVYFHGGGGTAGSVTVYDQILRRLAHHTQRVVVAAEYRLAPENPYPAGQNDAYTVLCGVSELLARRKIAHNGQLVVAGDSHGGALVTNLLRDPRLLARQRARLEGETGLDGRSKQYSMLSSEPQDSMSPDLEAKTAEQMRSVCPSVIGQVLIYPSVDFSMSQPSITRYAQGYLLSCARIAWYFAQYFRHDEDKKVQSALYADDAMLAGQPPALIVNAEFDPLYDEGVAYAERLRQAGVSVQHETYGGVIHAFMNMEDLHPQVCEAVYGKIAEFVNELG